jgi:hypothetical protein
VLSDNVEFLRLEDALVAGSSDTSVVVAVQGRAFSFAAPFARTATITAGDDYVFDSGRASVDTALPAVGITLRLISPVEIRGRIQQSEGQVVDDDVVQVSCRYHHTDDPVGYPARVVSASARVGQEFRFSVVADMFLRRSSAGGVGLLTIRLPSGGLLKSIALPQPNDNVIDIGVVDLAPCAPTTIVVRDANTGVALAGAQVVDGKGRVTATGHDGEAVVAGVIGDTITVLNRDYDPASATVLPALIGQRISFVLRHATKLELEVSSLGGYPTDGLYATLKFPAAYQTVRNQQLYCDTLGIVRGGGAVSIEDDGHQQALTYKLDSHGRLALSALLPTSQHATGASIVVPCEIRDRYDHVIARRELQVIAATANAAAVVVDKKPKRLTVSVVDVVGAPVVGAAVSVGDTAFAPPWQAATDINGMVVLDDLWTDTPSIAVSAEGRVCIDRSADLTGQSMCYTMARSRTVTVVCVANGQRVDAEVVASNPRSQAPCLPSRRLGVGIQVFDELPSVDMYLIVKYLDSERRQTLSSGSIEATINLDK